MRREDLEHILRAASAITKQNRFLVVGSQAISGVMPAPTGVLGYSMEVDLVPIDAPDLADLIDGSLGELSPFHDTLGYYAQGVGLETAVLPQGWDHRLHRIEDPISGAVGLCLDPGDLAASKLVAGREKDPDFIAAMLELGIIRLENIRSRIAELPAERLRPCGLTPPVL
ncbi:MAG: DUF6036 family nucleotidyltransferase [Acidiferrobacteraceae bacterium]